MLKRFVLAMVPVFMLAATVNADDGLFNIDVSSISDADVEVQEVNFDDLDVEKLAGEAGTEDSEEAIEACFRRFGYGRHYGGYGSYRPCYRPCYTYRYPTFHCYRPVYHTTYVPVYRHYWGCY
ncbi:MAG: hypothetical protein ACI9HK_000783 [Pirellulaceae bacterium]|jgi:hypothetical protein